MPTLSSIDVVDVQVTKDFQNPCKGVALLNYTVGCDGLSLHWRLGDWTKPPLDIGISPTTGKLCSLQFVMQDEKLLQLPPLIPTKQSCVGLPKFDLSTWPDNEQYLDEEQSMSCGWCSSSDFAVVIGEELRQAEQQCIVNSSFSLFFDQNRYLTGLIMHSLTISERSVIENAFSFVSHLPAPD